MSPVPSPFEPPARCAGVFVDGRRGAISRNVFESLFDSDIAIEVHGPDGKVEHNVMFTCYYAGILVDAEGGGTATVANNLMESCAEDVFIEVRNAPGARVVRNRLRNGYRDGDCISAVNCDDALVTGNQVSNVNYAVEHGIYVMGARARVLSNTIDGIDDDYQDLTAIRVTGADALIARNRVRNCGSGDDYDTFGIDVAGANARVEDNSITQLGETRSAMAPTTPNRSSPSATRPRPGTR